MVTAPKVRCPCRCISHIARRRTRVHLKKNEVRLGIHIRREHCPDSARTQGANERVVLCLMNELVADHARVL